MNTKEHVSVELTGEPWRIHRMGMIPVGAAVHYFSKGVGATLAAVGLLGFVCLIVFAIADPQPGGAPEPPNPGGPPPQAQPSLTAGHGTEAPEPPNPPGVRPTAPPRPPVDRSSIRPLPSPPTDG